MQTEVKLPKYLYHYTSINTLAYILQNKQILFNSLINVDDLEEQITLDKDIWAKYCFVSCWSANSRESIPMWEMYSSGMQGVRIRLPSDLFLPYSISYSDFAHALNMPLRADANSEEIVNDNEFMKSVVPPELYFSKECSFIGSNKLIPQKIEYTDNISLLFPTVKVENENQVNLFWGLIGKYKRKCWSFQKEWRFILTANPFSIKNIPGYALLETLGVPQFSDALKNTIMSCPDLSFSRIKLKIDETKLVNIKIVLGPKTSLADQIIVEALCEKYIKNTIPKDIISPSTLKIRKQDAI